jgi:predicted GH43/DUF377 family glycosyl hydrolase
MTKFFKITSLLVLSVGISVNVFSQKLPVWALGPFIRPENVGSIIIPDTSSFIDPMTNKLIQWESSDTFNPAAAVKNGEIYILYRAEDNTAIGIGSRTSRIGIAISKDGISVKRSSHPVLFPANDLAKEYEWTGGCEDPRVSVTEDGTYVILYTEWNHKVPRLAAAISKNLTTWEKNGPVFKQAFNGRFFSMATKSASIITKIVKGKQVIAKINGKYMMYWGENHVYAATSEDLINWTPLINEDGTLKVLISPRKGYFDSELTECGPPALMTDKGIILFYNGKNSNNGGDINYTSSAYCAGQALFSLSDPTMLISRLNKPFLVPETAYEKSGQYPAGTVFIEGMAYLHKKWFLYYGCADSRVAVAVYDPSNK